MNWDAARIAARAAQLDAAARSAQPIAQSPAGEAPDTATAYAVQAALHRLHVARGDARVGMKLAFTNIGMRTRLGIAAPAAGSLYASMVVADGATIARASRIGPRLEIEIAYRLGRPLRAGVGLEDALAAIEAIAPAIEIVDSRYRDFRFVADEVIADNTGASGFVIGPWQSPAIDFRDLAVVLEIDGKEAARGSTAIIFDGPHQTLPEAARLALHLGMDLEAGCVIMGGSAIDPVALGGGRSVRAAIAGLGEVGFTVDG